MSSFTIIKTIMTTPCFFFEGIERAYHLARFVERDDFFWIFMLNTL